MKISAELNVNGRIFYNSNSTRCYKLHFGTDCCYVTEINRITNMYLYLQKNKKTQNREQFQLRNIFLTDPKFLEFFEKINFLIFYM